MSISWGDSLVVVKNKKEVDDKFKLWSDIIKPKDVNELIGNKEALEECNKWFMSLGNSSSNRCLIIYGKSGTGKSSFIDVISKSHGFKTINTYGDKQRTPQKMESLFRELTIVGEKGILVLDDAESFLKETTVIKPLTRLFKNNEMKNGKRVLCIIICNVIDKSMNILKNHCDVIEFKSVLNNDMYRIFRRLSAKMSRTCYIPPMASYIVSSNTDGNIAQAVNQMQFMYNNTPFPVLKKKNNNKRMKLDKSSKKDDHFQMWISTYKQSDISCFVTNKDIDVLDSLYEMNKGFLDNIGDNLQKEYIKYFDEESLEYMSNCSDYISNSDIKRPEFDEDRLYETENSDKWSEDDTNYLINVYFGIKCIQGRDKIDIKIKRRKKNKFGYD